MKPATRSPTHALGERVAKRHVFATRINSTACANKALPFLFCVRWLFCDHQEQHWPTHFILPFCANETLAIFFRARLSGHPLTAQTCIRFCPSTLHSCIMLIIPMNSPIVWTIKHTCVSCFVSQCAWLFQMQPETYQYTRFWLHLVVCCLLGYENVWTQWCFSCIVASCSLVCLVAHSGHVFVHTHSCTCFFNFHGSLPVRGVSNYLYCVLFWYVSFRLCEWWVLSVVFRTHLRYTDAKWTNSSFTTCRWNGGLSNYANVLLLVLSLSSRSCGGGVCMRRFVTH